MESVQMSQKSVLIFFVLVHVDWNIEKTKQIQPFSKQITCPEISKNLLKTVGEMCKSEQSTDDLLYVKVFQSL